MVGDLVDLTDGEVVPIDGKTIRGAKSGGKKSPFHMVSAWASTNNMVLGQVRFLRNLMKLQLFPDYWRYSL